jgi:hypothetical protein
MLILFRHHLLNCLAKIGLETVIFNLNSFCKLMVDLKCRSNVIKFTFNKSLYLGNVLEININRGLVILNHVKYLKRVIMHLPVKVG